MNPNVGMTTTQSIMQALRDKFPEDPLLEMRGDLQHLQQEIADGVNSTRKYVASCASCRRGLARPAGQHLLRVYKSTGCWNTAWNTTRFEYSGKLPLSKIHDYKKVAMADPVFRRGLPS